jgi:phosphatidate cytidylyltransferase
MPVPRKLLIRVIGAPLLVAALCGIIAWGHRLETAGKPNVPVQVLLLVVAVLCGIEYFGMVAAKGIPTARWAGILTVAVTFIPWPLLGVSVEGGVFLHVAVGTAYSLYLLTKLVFRYGAFTPEGAGLSLLGVEYVSLLEYLTQSWSMAPQAYSLLFLLAAGKGSDMAAFVAGKSIGKHKMSPVVSPNKTWEGGIAGGIVGTAAGTCVLWFTPLRHAYGRWPFPALLLLALLVTMAAQVGDLIKSAFKRWAGVKDSGRLLPEFGGMIDMVDSFIIAAPVLALVNLVYLQGIKGS